MAENQNQAVIMYNEKLLEHDRLTAGNEGGRLGGIIDELQNVGLWNDKVAKQADIAPMKRLRDIHNSEFLDALHKRVYSGLEKLDPKTPVIKESFEIARFDAGGVLDAVDKVMSEEVKRAFCLTAMPGHHSGITSTGFGSIVNPIAAGAHYLTKKFGLNRVAVIDIDSEHGSGTQEIFYQRKDVLTVSIHEYPGATGTGYYDEMGGKGALGYNINIPFVSGYGDREYRVCMSEIIDKILSQFAPEFILVGIGTNVLDDDPGSHLVMSEYGVVSVFPQLMELSEKYCNGRIISVLEGGTPGKLMAKSISQHSRLLVNKIAESADRGRKEELISYADWYGYAKLLKAQFKKIWKM